MELSEVLKVAGAAVRVADASEELIEFVESLGDVIRDLTSMEEWEEFRELMEEYIHVRQRSGSYDSNL